MPSKQPTRAPRTWIVADDLTGACDAGVAFAQRGIRTQVLLGPEAESAAGAEVVALCTGTRDLPVDEALGKLQAALRSLPGGEVFKKIDSVFRGNTFREIAAVVAAFPERLAVLAPAYPAQGRTTRDGHLVARDLTGTRTLCLRSGLEEHGVTVEVLPANLSSAALAVRMQDVGAVLCDAHTQAQLDTVVEAAASLDREIVWIGSAGLAQALASRRHGLSTNVNANWSGGRLLAFVGSDHPVTMRQIGALHDAHKVALWGENGWDEVAPVAVMKIEHNVTSTEVIREATARLGPAACLFMTGGDTALQVCRALGMTALCLQVEFAPGVPQATAMGGDYAGVTVILKSGGFGEADLLNDIARQFTKRGTALNEQLPKVVVTLGDPAGVGGEVTLKALTDEAIRASAHWIVLGDQAAIDAAERTTGVKLASLNVDFRDLKSLPAGEPVHLGELRAEYGKAAAAYVAAATRMCLSGEADAMVTAPLNKEAVTMSGLKFSGHTEYIAEICGATESRMLLAGVKFSVVHVSTHVSLREACNLDTERIIRTIQLGNEAVKLLGHARPRIAVCGLNPHAGEHGLFGAEDQEFIVPAVEACRAMGIDCEGPVAADTIFFRAARGSHDLIVAMYHDQGHIPMKLLAFETTVNTSLGIPIIRTSVDHGTAFDIAGLNLASDDNMRAAMTMAVTMAHHRMLQAAGQAR